MTEPDNPFGRDAWPRSIAHPDQFEGGGRLGIDWETVDATDKERKRAMAAWVEALPAMAGLRRLKLWSRVPQAVLEAACAIEGLEVLEVKWTSATGFDALARLTKLQALWMGSAAKVQSIEPIAALSTLSWLELGELKRVRDFSPLVKLTGLRTLGITGSMWGRQDIASLEPFAAMTWLHTLWLDTASLDSVRPLAALTHLRELGLGGRLPFEEYAWLSAKLPRTECNRFAPYVDASALGMARCGRCDGARLMLTGRGKPVVCAVCDKARVDKQLAQWEAVRAAARVD